MSYQEYVKKVRSDYNLTQKELSAATGISLANIKKIEAGTSEMPNEKAVNGFCNFLHCTTINFYQLLMFTGIDPYIKMIKSRECTYLEWYFAQKYIEENSAHQYACTKREYNLGNGVQTFILPALVDSGKKNYYLRFAPKFDLYESGYPDNFISYLNETINKVIWSTDLPSFRYIEFVFDATDKKDQDFYRAAIESNINANAFKFGLIFTLYDYKSCKVLDEKLINVKKRI